MNTSVQAAAAWDADQRLPRFRSGDLSKTQRLSPGGDNTDQRRSLARLHP